MASTRKQQILDTAAELFAARGFHGVSVHDIGAACGISGPALYRHFASKDDVLTQTLVNISQELLATGRARADAADDSVEALSALIGWHIDFALGNPALIVIQEREWTNLDAAGQGEVRALQLAYIDIWVEKLLEVRPTYDHPTARAAVQATFGLLNSTPHSARIGDAHMRELLSELATSALLRERV
ncbi:MAG: TetR family transcriptional regulator [Nocardioidaceae bacterium]|nr:TetR family transcriptional regulator [Nocardioidaceae bacterium]